MALEYPAHGQLRAANELPKSYLLSQDCRNPFNQVTEISFDLPGASEVRPEIFNLLGQRVVTLIDGHREERNIHHHLARHKRSREKRLQRHLLLLPRNRGVCRDEEDDIVEVID